MALLFAALVGYYAVHKPLNPGLAASLAADAVHLMVPILILFACGSVGTRLLPMRPAGELAGAAVQAAVGLGVFGVAWLPVGAFLGVGTWPALAILGLALIGLWRSGLEWAARLRRGLGELRPSGVFEVCLAAAVALLVGIDLLEALGPPLHFDALVYHLSLPAQFLSQGRVAFTPDNPFWGNPLLMEMMNTWAMALGGASSAMVLGLLVACLAAAGTLGFVRRYWPAGAWVSAASLMCGQTLWSSMAWGYDDWPAALFGLAVLICLDLYRKDGEIRWSLWAGALAGFAMGTKYTAGVVAICGLAGLALMWRGRPSPRAAAAFVLAAGLTFMIWPVKNLLATGAPLYPFVGGAPWVTPLRQAFFSGTHSAGFQPVGPGVPIFATIFGVEGGPGYAATIGPLLLGLGLAALFVPFRADTPSGLLAAFVLAGWAAWGMAGFASELLSQSKLYLVIFPAWAALAGMGYDGLRPARWGSVRFGRLAGALVLLVMSLTAIAAVNALSFERPLGVVVGTERADEAAARRLGAYLPAMRAVGPLGKPGSVAMLWEPRGYDCQPTCLPDTWIDRWYTLRRTTPDNQAILAGWRSQGLAYVLVNQAGMAFIRDTDERYTLEDWNALDELLKSLSLVSTFGDGYSLYALTG